MSRGLFIPSAGSSTTLQANGQPTAANNIVFDGATTPTSARVNVGADEPPTSRFRKCDSPNQFDAEWDELGAVINAVTKSGTNQFSGSAFNFYTSKGMTNKTSSRKPGGGQARCGQEEWGGTPAARIAEQAAFFSVRRLYEQEFSNTSPPARP
jgi:hypothetical protein